MHFPTQQAMAALDDAWAASWPGEQIGSHHVGQYGTGTTLEFHQLPTHRIHSEAAVEYAETLLRSRALIGWLARAGSTDEVLVVERSWSQSAEDTRRDSWLEHFIPAVHWQSRVSEPGSDDHGPTWEHLHLTQLDVSDPELASLIILAANGEAAYPIVLSLDMSWVFSPCDEGAHLVTLDHGVAEGLRAAFPEWVAVLERTATPWFEAEPEWVVEVRNLTAADARLVHESLRGSAIIPDQGEVSIIDPHDTFSARLTRGDAQRLRVAMSGGSGVVFDTTTNTDVVLSPAEARDTLNWGFFSGQLDTFINEVSYRLPGEAVDGKLDRRFWNPSEDYSGIDGTPF